MSNNIAAWKHSSLFASALVTKEKKSFIASKPAGQENETTLVIR